jgi:predicted ATPase
LATVLAFMALNAPDTFSELVTELRGLIPAIKRIRFTRAEVAEEIYELLRVGDQTITRPFSRKVQGDALLFDFNHANDVSARTVSEGTLLLLGLLTVLMGPTRPRILLLDDLEHGLHPLVQKQVLEVLRRILERFPDLQVIATAHSPYLLDGLRPEEVRLTTTGADGYSISGRLVDHPQFNKWKDEMAPGELWSMFGEKWLAQKGGQS